MTNEEFDLLVDTNQDVYDAYMEYIMENCHGERVICNGDMLIVAAEEGYLYDAFREHWLEKNAVAA